MDFLTRLPVVGPVVAWVMRTRPYRVYEHYGERGCNRLAGAVTFFGFLAVFPLLTVAIAAAAATLSPGRVRELQQKIAEQVPGLSDSLDLDSLVRNAGTVGLISGVVLLISGLGWVDTMRASIRSVWVVEEDPGNVVLRKLWDIGVLIGLGAVCAVSLTASAVTATLTGQVAQWLGVERTAAGSFLLGLVGFLVAVATDMILFAYLLTAFPRIAGQRRSTVVQAALIGAVGFELLKLLLSSYISGVAAKSMYGAFGVPVALLLWINLVSRLLMYCASWTAVSDPEEARQRARERAEQAYREAGGEGSIGVAAAVAAAPAVRMAGPARADPVRSAGPHPRRRSPMAVSFAAGAFAVGLLHAFRFGDRRGPPPSSCP